MYASDKWVNNAKNKRRMYEKQKGLMRDMQNVRRAQKQKRTKE